MHHPTVSIHKDLFARLVPQPDTTPRHGILLGIKELDFDNNTHLHLKAFVPYTSPNQDLATLLSNHLNHRGQTVLGWYAVPDPTALAHADLPQIAAAYFDAVQSSLLKAVTADCLRQLRAHGEDHMQFKTFAAQIARELCVLFGDLVGLVVASDPLPERSQPATSIHHHRTPAVRPSTSIPFFSSTTSSSSLSTVHAFFSSPSPQSVSQKLQYNPFQTYLQHHHHYHQYRRASIDTDPPSSDYDPTDAVEAQVLLEIRAALLAGERQEQVARDIEIVRAMSVPAMTAESDEQSWWFPSSSSTVASDCLDDKRLKAPSSCSQRDCGAVDLGTNEGSRKTRPRRVSTVMAEPLADRDHIGGNGNATNKRPREAEANCGNPSSGVETPMPTTEGQPISTAQGVAQLYQLRLPPTSTFTPSTINSGAAAKSKRRSTDLPHDEMPFAASRGHTAQSTNIASHRKRIKLEPIASPQSLRVVAGQAASSYIRQTLSEDTLFYPADLDDDDFAFLRETVDITEIAVEGTRRVERTGNAVGRHIDAITASIKLYEASCREHAFLTRALDLLDTRTTASIVAALMGDEDDDDAEEEEEMVVEEIAAGDGWERRQSVTADTLDSDVAARLVRYRYRQLQHKDGLNSPKILHDENRPITMEPENIDNHDTSGHIATPRQSMPDGYSSSIEAKARSLYIERGKMDTEMRRGDWNKEQARTVQVSEQFSRHQEGEEDEAIWETDSEAEGKSDRNDHTYDASQPGHDSRRRGQCETDDVEVEAVAPITLERSTSQDPRIHQGPAKSDLDTEIASMTTKEVGFAGTWRVKETRQRTEDVHLLETTDSDDDKRRENSASAFPEEMRRRLFDERHMEGVAKEGLTKHEDSKQERQDSGVAMEGEQRTYNGEER